MVSLAVLADLTQAGEERDDSEEEESGVHVSLVMGAQKGGLQAGKASSRLLQEGVPHTVSIRAAGLASSVTVVLLENGVVPGQP